MLDMYDVGLFVLGLIGSAFFSGSEAVLMTIPQDRVKQLIEDNEKKYKNLEFLLNKPNELLTTILIGNNLVNVFLGALTTTIAMKLFQSNVIAIATGVTTTLILIFGEVFPKTFARSSAERLVVPLLFILKFFYYLFSPAVFFITFLLESFLGKNAKINERLVTQNDIEFMVNQAEEEKSIDSKQIDMLNSVLEFPMIKVKDAMVPRTKVNGIQINSNFNEVIAAVREHSHTRYPIFEDNLDSPVGFLHVKDLAFVDEEERENFNLKKYIKDPFYVYESMKIHAVFDHMNKNKVHLALVKDESGLVVGIITLEDIMEEIFGEILDEHDTEEADLPTANHIIGPDGLTVSGVISLRDLYNEYDIKIPLNDNYSTLTGFILDMLEDVFPKEGQVILWENFSFELEKVTNSNIEKIIIKSLDGHTIESATAQEKIDDVELASKSLSS